MPVDSVTIGTLVSRIAFHLTNNATAETDLSTEAKFALDRVLRAIVREVRPRSFVVESTISATSGTASYLLATDVFELIYPSLRITNSRTQYPIEMIELQDYDASGMPYWMTVNAIPRHAALINQDASTGAWRLRFYPTPDASYTVNYSYIGYPTRITSSTTDGTELDPRFPRDLEDALIHGACMSFPQYLGADQQIAFQKFYMEAVKNYRSTATGIDGAFYQRATYQPVNRRSGVGAFPTTIYGGSPVR